MKDLIGDNVTVELSLRLDIEDGHELEISKLEHHIDWLLNLEEWPEIKAAYDVHVELVERMTYKRLLELYGFEMVTLSVYDRNGVELADDYEIPDDTLVLGWSQRSGCWDVDVDI